MGNEENLAIVPSLKYAPIQAMHLATQSLFARSGGISDIFQPSPEVLIFFHWVH